MAREPSLKRAAIPIDAKNLQKLSLIRSLDFTVPNRLQFSLYNAAWSPDMSKVVVDMDEGPVLWDARQWQLLWSSSPDEGYGCAAYNASPYASGSVWSPDGALLAMSTSAGTVLLLDAATGKQTGVLKRETAMHVDGLAFSPDRSLLTAVLKEGNVVVWDVKAAQPVRTPEGFTDQVYHVAWSPDGRTLASITADGGLILWRVAL
jgi:WD40 repeat protein